MAKYLIVAIYLVILAIIGIWSGKRTKTMNQFLLGGREAGAWMSAFAYGTTYFSAVIFIGYAGRNGWGFGAWAVLIGLGNALIGTYLAWRILARRTRDFTHRLKLSTMPEFFGSRYNSKGMKFFAALIIFIFLTPYSASVYSGLSYLFEMVFHVDYVWAVIAMAAISALYLVLGGYIASLVADFFQGIIMFFGVLIMVYFALNANGLGGVTEGLSKLGDMTTREVPIWNLSSPSSIINLISLILLTSVGSWGLPQMIHKFYAIKDEQAIRKGTLISTLFCTVIGVGAYFTGAVARVFYEAPQNKNLLADITSNGNLVFDKIMPNFINSALPEILLGIIIVLIFSASVTTLTGLVLVSSSSLTMDLIKPSMKKQMSSSGTLLTTRLLCILFVVLSVCIALIKSPIQMLMSLSWGTISGSFLAPYVLGLYWRGVTKAGAWTGMITGVAVSIGLFLINNFNTAGAPMYGVISMISSMALTVLVSLFTKKYNNDHIKMVFEGEKEEA